MRFSIITTVAALVATAVAAPAEAQGSPKQARACDQKRFDDCNQFCGAMGGGLQVALCTAYCASDAGC